MSMMMTYRLKIWFCAVAAVFLVTDFACAALPKDYPGLFYELSGLIDSNDLGLVELIRGGWLAARYFAPAEDGLDFNQARFTMSRTAGEAGLSGLFLAERGTAAHHQFVCKTLETDRMKRNWMGRIFGTEGAFFQSLENGEDLRPLISALPSTTGLRTLLQRLHRSPDVLVRRAGLFWGYWLADGDYWKMVREMTKKDLDVVNRACAMRLLKSKG